jgi:hypothetical protein
VVRKPLDVLGAWPRRPRDIFVFLFGYKDKNSIENLYAIENMFIWNNVITYFDSPNYTTTLFIFSVSFYYSLSIVATAKIQWLL